jgi:metallo-beta-lactamase class B
VRLILLSLCLASSLAAQTTAAERAAWNRPVQPFRIVGNVYYVGAEGVSSFLIATPAGSILIDGGLPETAPRIERNIATLGFRIADVKYLLNSHAHFDHAGGLAQLKRDSGAQMVASRADGAVISAGRGRDFPAAPVDRFVEDGAKVELGGAVLTAVLTPGHTKGCTTWAMPVSAARQTYNVVFYCSTTVVDKLKGNREYPRIAADYRRSFDALAKLPCDVFLAPHPGLFHMDDKRAKLAARGPNPFIDPGEMRAYVERSRADFERALAK